MKSTDVNAADDNRIAWWESPGALLFFGAGQPTVAVRIGVVALTRGCGLDQAIARRFKQIQANNHELIELLGVIRFTEGKYPTRAAEVLERELHVLFAAQQRFRPGTRSANGPWTS